MAADLIARLERRVLIGDGAVGTLLGERGVGFGHPYARANLSHPEMVTDIHEEYLRAGADVIETIPSPPTASSWRPTTWKTGCAR